MTAKEMFSNLGYQLIVDTYNAIDYVKTEGYENPLYITFERNAFSGIEVEKYFKDICNAHISMPITYTELKAINKQIEELGL